MLYGAEHVKRYVETDGEEGHIWQPGVPTLILTTVGRKSGKEHSTPLIYVEDGPDYAVVASKGGAESHPLWYLNLTANPEVKVQVRADRFTARARTADEEERARLWPRLALVWPEYDSYQAKTDRVIPIVVLERVS
ncbi:nitroreductase family deazaflavin-dependent oxidoreductase [Actinorugispora endophytica]|uniref:Deazaflavin-dependent oxidoreductase (Nitroreductase family) n=1 Tax=Actinorugispora endophytica TaxID=1605990 RepID=A0A4R6USH5_9ACTN|nr:nitroreductase family deazaflavin-dependent oxidoreductase [Actinorugispora endophytica]TDQ50238.1 deazaflavin-dependent oxidoreductase (nitroreductase family) [Actinorugispora endophytica]